LSTILQATPEKAALLIDERRLTKRLSFDQVWRYPDDKHS